MCNQRLLRYLRQAIAKNDLETVRKIYFDNSELLNNLNCKDVMELLVSETGNSVDKKINESMFNFIKLKTDIDLRKWLNSAIFDGNVRLAEFFLKNEVKLEGLEWTEKSMESCCKVFSIKNTRKNMLSLLIQYGFKPAAAGHDLLLKFIGSYAQRDDRDAVEIAEILINSGIPIDKVDDSNESALFKSVYWDNIKMTSFLISKGADVNQISEFYGSALQWAVRDYLNNEMIHLLVLNGADVNAINEGCGWTPFQGACAQHNTELIRFFLSHGADITIPDYLDNTPFTELVHGNAYYDQCSLIMIKEFSRLTFENLSFSEGDMSLIHTHSKNRKHFKMCLAELQQMANTIFYAPHSFYSVFKKSISIKKLASFAKNEELVSKFKENLSKFPYYKSDLQKLLEEALQLRDRLEDVQKNLSSAFDKIFPDIVIRKLANNMIL